MIFYVCFNFREKFYSNLSKERSRSEGQQSSEAVSIASRDSAIDSDLQEWENETIQLDIVSVPVTLPSSIVTWAV